MLSTPSRTERRAARAGSQRKNRSQAVKCSAVAVTREQALLVEVARSWRRHYGEWPTAAELAVEAEITQPHVWADLKTLERLGVVRWRRRVEVVRAPDGVVFMPPAGAP